MSIYHQTRNHLQQLQAVMQELNRWQVVPPNEQAFQSSEPFALDTMNPYEWLQWIFIPRMYALLESKSELPYQIAISPYIEEALKDTENVHRLLKPLVEIEQLLQNQI